MKLKYRNKILQNCKAILPYIPRIDLEYNGIVKQEILLLATVPREIQMSCWNARGNIYG
jgi:hypothetical protein